MRNQIKNLLKLSLVLLFFLSIGCSHQIIQKDFEPNKKIQVIPVTKVDYVYAQNDFLINSTLEKEPDVGLAWCGASLGSAFLLSFPFMNKAKRNKHKYITDYNNSF